MAIITWDPRLETKHAGIDEQHRALIQAFNDLHMAMKQGKGKDEVGRTLSFLKDYTVSHFKMEEDLMGRHGYPNAQRHKDLHKAFVTTASDLVDQFNSGKTLITLPVMTFIEGWLIEHIQGEDFRLAEFLRTKA
jgi:hemerythrin-like metal-binding protein